MQDAVGSIGDSLIEDAFEADNARKLRAAVIRDKKRKRTKLVKSFSVIAACLCLCACALVYFIGRGSDDIVKVSSPVSEVNSIDEMRRCLGFSVPVLENKAVSSYILYSFNNYAQQGKIIYSDGSEFKMARGNGDISGVFGAKAEGSAEYEGVTVYYYSLLDSHYAVWSYNGYACCYYAADGENNFQTVINEIIKLIK